MLTFAIGDVHGCLDLLRDLLARVEKEAGGHPHRLVFLGDLVDRGPDSAGVIALVRAMQAPSPSRVVVLKGNHEDLLLRGIGRPRTREVWLDNGGEETLASFGARRPEEIPADVIAWIAACPTAHEDALRCYVHAGLNPDRAMADQVDGDRLCIREAFLEGEHDFGRYVVHGHTPRRDGLPDMRRFRVNLDTAACYGGRLTAGLFTQTEARPADFLQAG